MDDQESNRFFTTRLLEKAGHAVVTAGDGREALARWEREPFDLILMDVQMPHMSGIDATVAVRERERERGGHVPIIAVTARALKEERETIRNHGFDGYVTKPIEFGVLIEEMKRCLGGEDSP